MEMAVLRGGVDIGVDGPGQLAHAWYHNKGISCAVHDALAVLCTSCIWTLLEYYYGAHYDAVNYKNETLR